MIEKLQALLHVAPVMGYVHPLWLLCLPAEVEISPSARQVAERLDSLELHSEQPILINEYVPAFADRFLTLHLPDHPPASLVNQALPSRLLATPHILTQNEIGSRIVIDSRERGYETVILMLVDGLSYEEAKDWPYETLPCLVAGPSITFARTDSGDVLPDVGFPAITGKLSVARQLAQIGIPHSRGYSYWEREQNDVSAFLFSGMPLKRVRSISQALEQLQQESLRGTYVQLVREGTDGLAHSRREVTPSEVTATVKAILDDFRRLIALVEQSGCKGVVYLVSDHGILWRHGHSFEGTGQEPSSHVRYSWQRPADIWHVSVVPTSRGDCHLFHYPYIARQIRANDGGVHGGLSYWESVVPFVRVEVIP